MEQRRLRSSRWSPEWSPERWLEVLLAMLVLFVFVGRPIVAEYPQADLALEIILTLVLASGVAATTHRGGFTIAIVAAITIAVGWVAWGTRSSGVREIHNAVAMLHCLALAAYVLSEVFRATEVERHQIEGAMAAYLLLGVAWSFACNLVFMIRPGSVTFGNAMPGTIRRRRAASSTSASSRSRRSATATARRRSPPPRCCPSSRRSSGSCFRRSCSRGWSPWRCTTGCCASSARPCGATADRRRGAAQRA